MDGIDPAALTRKDRYRLLIGAVVPRPIAWITTVDGAGTVNLAPFSFFNGVTANPLVLSIAIAQRDPLKDTLRNLRASGEAVVQIAPPEQMRNVHQSGGEYASAVSETQELGLELIPSQRVRPPRLACAQVAFECRLLQEVPVGDPPTSLCLLSAIHVHVAAAIAGADGLPDPHRLRAPARLGDRCYLDGEAWRVVDLPAQQVPPGKGLAGP
jgi:flavin reductase (DIM6/NTAB) family NADH-FMN oxidoreductase RutF